MVFLYKENMYFNDHVFYTIRAGENGWPENLWLIKLNCPFEEIQYVLEWYNNHGLLRLSRGVL